MKFLLVTSNQDVMFEYRNLRDLALALTQLGHEARAEGIRRPSIYHDVDVVIEINYRRHEMVPAKAIHIAWVQDYIEETSPDYASDCLPQDMFYTFGDISIMEMPKGSKHHAGSLLYAANPKLLDRQPIEQSLDFSIAAFIPEPAEFRGREAGKDIAPGTRQLVSEKQIFDLLTEVMEECYRPLSGLGCHRGDVTRMHDEITNLVLRSKLPVDIEDAWVQVKKQVSQFTHAYTRMMDRRDLAKMILSISDEVVFQGFNWGNWPEFKLWARPYAQDQRPLIYLYQSTRVNVHNNVYGFALGSRVFECMAVGGFIMANESPHYGKAGQMTESFEPEVHFGEYNAKTFCERARYWLAHPDKRNKAATKAKKIIKAKHLWEHRARQILRDLGVKPR